MNRLLPWCVGVSTLLLLTVVCLWEYYPPIVGPQRFVITFPTPLPVGTSEPLIVTGEFGAADFLMVRYIDAHTVAFSYDSWGHGGPTSPPIVIAPGSRHALAVTMPSLAAIPGSPDPPTDRLLITLDGTSVLDAKVHFLQRRPLRAYFALNPAGGSSCGPEFHGQLFHADGRALRGDPRATFTRTDRFRGWLHSGRWQALALVLLSAAVTWVCRGTGVPPVSSLLRGTGVPPVSSRLRLHRTFLLTAALCSLAFAAMITNGTFQLLFRESFCNFYDFQVLSFLQGRLDVPEESLQGESFVYDGKIYGYFGVTPALLRLPFVIFGVAFGQLSRVAMLVFYAATLLGAYLLLLDATCLLRPDRPRPAAWQTILFTLHVGLGSTVFFLGSRAYIYHEAILCGIMFAVFSCWCSLRHLANPTGRWWLGALALGTLSVHARPPTGLFALTVLGCVAATHLLRVWSAPKITGHKSKIISHLAVGALSVLGVFSFNALSYAKFRTLEGCPLRLNVQYSPTRLAKIDSKQFHLGNIPYGLNTYLLRPTLETSAQFPWLYLGPYLPTEAFPSAKMDLPDRTAALPFGMTGLFALATAACAWACKKNPAARAPVFTLWAASVPLSFAMFAAIATAERYTGDFVPFLVCAAAFGLAAPVWRAWLATLLIAATLWACLLTFAMTLHYQGAVVWGVPESVTQNYRQLRARVDGFFLPERTSPP